jgi:hypothetical protein
VEAPKPVKKAKKANEAAMEVIYRPKLKRKPAPVKQAPKKKKRKIATKVSSSDSTF